MSTTSQKGGQTVPNTLDDEPSTCSSLDHLQVEQALHTFFIDNPSYPCIMARSVFELEQFEYGIYPTLGDTSTDALGEDLLSFLAKPAPEQGFRSFLAVFATPKDPVPEETFEQRLWSTLERLHRLDHKAGQPWDPSVSANPNSPRFSFSFGGCAFYIVGMHPGASRPARRFRWPLLAFNLHSQFETLRQQGRYKKVRRVIRQRDQAFAGSVNPMVTDFGKKSEAPQYSGRNVSDTWRCPFRPHS